MIDTFSDITDARILIGSAVDEAEALFEQLVMEARELADPGEKEFVLKILSGCNGVEGLAHVIALNHSGGLPAIKDLIKTHDLGYQIATTTNMAWTILSANPTASQTRGIVRVLSTSEEIIDAPKDALRRIEALLRQIQSEVITTVHAGRAKAIEALTAKCLELPDRKTAPSKKPDDVLTHAVTLGLSSLPLSQLNLLASNTARRRELVDLVYYYDDTSIGNRHWSWTNAILDAHIES